MYLEVIAVLHYKNYDGDIHASVLKACISSKYSKCISAIKRILNTTTMYTSSSSFVHLCLSLYCDACLKSSVLRVGVKTLHTIQYNEDLVSSEISDLCEISDLLLFWSYCASRERNKVWGLLFSCVLYKLKLFGKMPDTHNKLTQYGNNYNHWKMLGLALDLNYFSFSNPNPTHLPKHQTPSSNHQFSQRIEM